MKANYDPKVVNDFGNEWKTFDQSNLDESELKSHFDQYFKIFPTNILSENSVGFDAGCGSGRWAKYIAPKIKKLFCIDASKKALEVAKKNLKGIDNCEFVQTSLDDMPMKENTMDFLKEYLLEIF